MPRPTNIRIDPSALMHNLEYIKRLAPGKSICAMVKSNAYGCGIKSIVPVLEGHVAMFGVACLEEALELRKLGSQTVCLLNQGVFSEDEYRIASQYGFACVIHHMPQVEWLLNTPLPKPINIWIKVNTGMYRLGFEPKALSGVVKAITACSWVNQQVGLMTHFACADEPMRKENTEQVALFQSLSRAPFASLSMVNSAALMAFPASQADLIRPGIMLYGVSPFANQTGMQLGLKPVMHLTSKITAIHHNPPGAHVGYGGTWNSTQESIIGIVPVGYGDGYPRHIASNTPVWINGHQLPIVGRVSMDMLTVDLTNHPEVAIGDFVELWGEHIPIETIAQSAGTIGYELLCQVTDRARANFKPIYG